MYNMHINEATSDYKCETSLKFSHNYIPSSSCYLCCHARDCLLSQLIICPIKPH